MQGFTKKHFTNPTEVEDAIVNGVTTLAPSQNAVYDALQLYLLLTGGTLTGTLTLASGITITGAGGTATISFDGSTGTNINKKLFLGTASTYEGVLYFYNGTNANTVNLRSGATTSDYSLYLPLVQGASGEVMKNNGSGVLSWVTPAYATNNLSFFAATTSAQLAGIISDETGSGALVFAVSPALTGTPTAPTAALNDSSTTIATTAFVQTQIGTDIIITGGNQTTALATNVTITELVTATLTANKRYYISGVIQLGCSGAGGTKLAMVVPTGATSSIAGTGRTTSSGTTVQFYIPNGGTLSSAWGTSTTSMVMIEGEITVAGTAAVLQFEFASTTAGQTSTIYQQGTKLNVKLLN